MVRTPLRAAPGLACTPNVTVPLPLPLVPLVTEIQGTLAEAVQVQLRGPVTVTVSVPPAPPNERFVADS